MITIRETEEFAAWMHDLKDSVVRAKVLVRLDRLQLGLSGDMKPVGRGVSELRIDHGPGYRVYFVQQGLRSVVLLGGGSKATQRGDIRRQFDWRAHSER